MNESTAIPRKVLVLPANPADMSQQALETEAEKIRSGLSNQDGSLEFVIADIAEMTLDNLREVLLDIQPQIVHVCGVGQGTEDTSRRIMMEYLDENQGLFLVDQQNRLVNAADLQHLFARIKEAGVELECLFLSACYVAEQANAILNSVQLIIGTPSTISASGAIKFAKLVYSSLEGGKSYRDAFQYARVFIQSPHLMKRVPTIFLSRTPRGDAEQVTVARSSSRAQLYISYMRDEPSDARLASTLFSYFQENGFEVLNAQPSHSLKPDWAGRIDGDIQQADYMIALLSEKSVKSEMVLEEVKIAHRTSESAGGRPMILPVKLNKAVRYIYPLDSYLAQLNWAVWSGEMDTATLGELLIGAMDGESLPFSKSAGKQLQSSFVNAEPESVPITATLPPEVPGGAMLVDSPYYVERESDVAAMKIVEQEAATINLRQGVTLHIKAPRQMGKSSLLKRVVSRAAHWGKKTVYLDFQQFGPRVLEDAETFYYQFCAWLTDELDLDDRLDEFWNPRRGLNQRCTRYLQRYVLEEIGGPLLLAIDEADALLGCDFTSDFFGMLRSWHNNRDSVPWKHLDLLLVISTAPYLLIENKNQSPFNVGETIELRDFNREELSMLNQRYGDIFQSYQLDELHELLCGQPYLTRKAFYLFKEGRVTIDELLSEKRSEEGPFADHLRYHYYRIHNHPALMGAMSQIIGQHKCDDTDLFFRLRAAGLVKRGESNQVVPRCRLYEYYFKDRLR